uniref:HTH cro/C1-type domain-containing protein n=1 Tax=Cyprinus carpio carpio TaxID=630221 RepID=A0A9J7YGS5_CYPCA
MGKTADLTAVQKAIIDTLKREGKTQKEISERIGCSQSAVSRHLSGKSVGRKKCGKKRCTTRRGDRTLRKIVEKDRFQTLGDLRKQWTESGVETSRATVHRRVLLNQKQRQKRLTWATEKQHWTVAQWSKVLFSDESKFCMSFGNQGARVWRKTGEKEMPKMPEVQCQVPTVSDGLGCLSGSKAHACARWLWMFLLQTQSTASAGPPRSGIGPSPQSSSGSVHLFSLCSVFATLFSFPQTSH